MTHCVATLCDSHLIDRLSFRDGSLCSLISIFLSLRLPSPPLDGWALRGPRATMADMGGQIDKMVSFIHFEAKNKREEILAKAKQDKEAKKLETVHRERLKIEADFNKKIKNVETMEKMCATRPAPLVFVLHCVGETARRGWRSGCGACHARLGPTRRPWALGRYSRGEAGSGGHGATGRFDGVPRCQEEVQ